MLGSLNILRGVPLDMSRIHPECPGTADVLLRQDPDEDEEEDDGNRKDDDGDDFEEDDEGYSE